jgi:hypothetical protein
VAGRRGRPRRDDLGKPPEDSRGQTGKLFRTESRSAFLPSFLSYTKVTGSFSIAVPHVGYMITLGEMSRLVSGHMSLASSRSKV